MEILNILSTAIWIGLSLRCASLFIKLLHMDEDNEFIVFCLNIILLAGLNICIGLYTILNEPPRYSDCSTLQKFYFGTSLFQLFLSYCVIERIKRVGIYHNKQ